MANTKSLWLRLYTEILNDPKVQRLPDSLFRAYINLLCIAKEYSYDGVLPPKKDIAFFLRCPQKTVEKLCDGLQKNELLDAEGDTFIIHGWNNRQYESDNDPTANMRKRRQRERNKNQNVTPDVTDMSRVTSRPCHENVTRTETETETETDKEKSIREPQAATPPKKSKAFVPPTLLEVGEYCRANGYDVDPQKFVDFYTASSPPWHDSRGAPVKNWKQKVITWAGRDKTRKEYSGAMLDIREC